MKAYILSFFFFITLAPFVMASDGSILVCEEADFSALAQSPCHQIFSYRKEIQGSTALSLITLRKRTPLRPQTVYAGKPIAPKCL